MVNFWWVVEFAVTGNKSVNKSMGIIKNFKLWAMGKYNKGNICSVSAWKCVSDGVICDKKNRT